MERIPFVIPAAGTTLAASVLRSTPHLDVVQPGVIVTGSWLTVKEQMALRYAEELAARGYTCLIFDFAGFGESGGEPRQCEMPMRKAADIAAAARFLASLSFVRPGGVGHVAICASAQYGLRAIADGAPIASFVSVAGWYHDAATIQPFYGGAEGVGQRLAAAAAAMRAQIEGNAGPMVPAYAPEDPRAGMFFPLDYYERPERGAVPEWRNEMAQISWLYWLTFDGLRAASAVETPSLFVHGNGCVLPENARTVHDRIRAQKRLAWTDGNQVDFYDLPELVRPAVEEADRWFRATLEERHD